MDVRVVGDADMVAATETITLAFATDPVWSRAFARRDGRPDHLPAFWRLWLDGARRYDWVWMTDGAEAVSVWIPPGGTDLSADQEAAFERLAEDALGPDGAAYLEGVMACFEAAHPREAPHYYLSLLGTHPAYRGRGIGMALLEDNLGRIDALEAPAYLESSNPANDHRYERLGFVRRGQFTLPEQGPVVTTMWRTPGRAGAGSSPG